jgi:hypothetical protein
MVTTSGALSEEEHRNSVIFDLEQKEYSEDPTSDTHDCCGENMCSDQSDVLEYR